MNNKELQITRNDTARLVRHSNRCGSHRGCVRISTSNSLAHEIEKLRQCYRLLQEHKEFFTEAIFENGSRSDLLILDDNMALEIVDSESDNSLQEKERKYPVDFEVVRVSDEVVRVSDEDRQSQART